MYKYAYYRNALQACNKYCVPVYNIYRNIQDNSTKDEGFVENRLYNPLNVTKVDSSDERIIFLNDIEENNTRYVEFNAYSSGDPIIIENTVFDNDVDQDGPHPVLLTDSESDNESKLILTQL